MCLGSHQIAKDRESASTCHLTGYQATCVGGSPLLHFGDVTVLLFGGGVVSGLEKEGRPSWFSNIKELKTSAETSL
jgi:hypothetical protein